MNLFGPQLFEVLNKTGIPVNSADLPCEYGCCGEIVYAWKSIFNSELPSNRHRSPELKIDFHVVYEIMLDFLSGKNI